MNFVILIFTLLGFKAYASWDAATMCGNNHPDNRMTQQLTQSGKTLWCITAHCVLDDGVSARSRCVTHPTDDNDKKKVYSGGIKVDLNDSIKGPQHSASKGSAHTTTLQKGGACFVECRPEELIGKSGKKTIKFGLEKEACAACAINLPHTIPKSYKVIGHDRILHLGETCYYDCRIPVGDYSDDTTYSPKCLSCLAPQGLMPTIEYLVTKAGKCWELSEGNNKKYASQIPESVCSKQSKVYSTYYTKTYNIETIFFGKAQECFEVDEKTDGKHYKMPAQMSDCDPSSSVNNDSRGKIKDVAKPSPKAKSQSGAKRN